MQTKEERAAYQKEYGKKNKEKIRKQKKQYELANKEKISKTKKIYYENNKEEMIKKNAEQRKKNPESVKKAKKRYFDKNSEKLNEKARIYRKKHKKELAIKAKARRIKNKKRINHRRRELRSEHKDEFRAKDKKYIDKNREKYNKGVRDRRKNNANVHISSVLRGRLYKAIKNQQKVGSAIRDVGCAVEELKDYLAKLFYINPKSGEEMTWDNFGERWHIDHIVPLSVFDLANIEHFIFACHYSNLQPLWAEHNLRKNDNVMTPEEIRVLKETII